MLYAVLFSLSGTICAILLVPVVSQQIVQIFALSLPCPWTQTISEPQSLIIFLPEELVRSGALLHSVRPIPMSELQFKYVRLHTLLCFPLLLLEVWFQSCCSHPCQRFTLYHIFGHFLVLLSLHLVIIELSISVSCSRGCWLSLSFSFLFPFC